MTIIIGGTVLLASYVFGLSTQNRFVIILTTGTILGAEIFNSAIEEVLDILHPDHDPRVGRVKDLLAGGVLIFSLMSAVIWARMFLKVIFGWEV